MGEKMSERLVDRLLDLFEAAANRSRRMFFATNVACAAILLAEFNCYFPWIRRVAARTADPETQRLLRTQLWRLGSRASATRPATGSSTRRLLCAIQPARWRAT